MAATEVYAPQKRYTQKQRAAGLIPVTVWVPERDRERTVNFAEKLRRKFREDS